MDNLNFFTADFGYYENKLTQNRENKCSAFADRLYKEFSGLERSVYEALQSMFFDHVDDLQGFKICVKREIQLPKEIRARIVEIAKGVFDSGNSEEIVRIIPAHRKEEKPLNVLKEIDFNKSDELTELTKAAEAKGTAFFEELHELIENGGELPVSEEYLTLFLIKALKNPDAYYARWALCCLRELAESGSYNFPLCRKKHIDEFLKLLDAHDDVDIIKEMFQFLDTLTGNYSKKSPELCRVISFKMFTALDTYLCSDDETKINAAVEAITWIKIEEIVAKVLMRTGFEKKVNDFFDKLDEALFPIPDFSGSTESEDSSETGYDSDRLLDRSHEFLQNAGALKIFLSIEACRDWLLTGNVKNNMSMRSEFPSLNFLLLRIFHYKQNFISKEGLLNALSPRLKSSNLELQLPALQFIEKRFSCFGSEEQIIIANEIVPIIISLLSQGLSLANCFSKIEVMDPFEDIRMLMDRLSSNPEVVDILLKEGILNVLDVYLSPNTDVYTLSRIFICIHHVIPNNSKIQKMFPQDLEIQQKCVLFVERICEKMLPFLDLKDNTYYLTSILLSVRAIVENQAFPLKFTEEVTFRMLRLIGSVEELLGGTKEDNNDTEEESIKGSRVLIAHCAFMILKFFNERKLLGKGLSKLIDLIEKKDSRDSSTVTPQDLDEEESVFPDFISFRSELWYPVSKGALMEETSHPSLQAHTFLSRTEQ